MAEISSALERLCAHYGIATRYYDIGGQRHAASADCLAALLAEFGVFAATPEQAAAALQQAQAATWREALPPVVTVTAGQAHWRFRVQLSHEQRLHWSLALEDGTCHRGAVDVAALKTMSRADIDGTPRRECEIAFDLALPSGYHRLRIEGLGDALVVAAPPHCHLPSVLTAEGKGGRIWGTAVQLYSLRSARNWGIGDFGDLLQLIEQWARRGADIIGLNPLHALFPHNPSHISPYSPSSRLGLNVLYLDVEAIEDFIECTPARQHVGSARFQARLAQLRATEWVDYAGVAAAKFEILKQLYAHFREWHLGRRTPRADEFRDFQTASGAALRWRALFDTLQEHFHAADASVWGWPVWPQPFRDCHAPAVADFAATHLERIEWFEYLQWQAQRQLARAAEKCRTSGMTVGLYLDLAVSVDRAGADVWVHAADFAAAASVGAPPDDFNPNGQNWSLPAWRPDRLRNSGYALFAATLRANMRCAGALRIDHVMGLMRLFWIAPGKTAQDGAYVHYPLEEMLAIVALESERNHCMVIGEDLGTVADELRSALARHAILSYKLLYFERDAQGGFKPPADYSRHALVAVSTHDLATLAGWWKGVDLQTRLELDLYPNRAMYEQQVAERARDRLGLALALECEGFLAQGEAVSASQQPELSPAWAAAIHAFIAAAPSQVMMVQMEDVLGVEAQANMPGTIEAHPNWRRKLPRTLEQMAADERISMLANLLQRARPA